MADEFVKRVSESAGITDEEVSKLKGVLCTTLADVCADGDVVSLPGFGSFALRKFDEEIEVKPDGKRWLLPPAIKIVFRPSVILRKKLNNG